MDHLDDLRALIASRLVHSSWESLPEECRRLELPWSARADLPKEAHLRRLLRLASVSDLMRAGRSIMNGLPPSAERLDLEDALAWAECGGAQQITEVTRFNIALVFDELKLPLSGPTKRLSDFIDAVRPVFYGSPVVNYDYLGGRLVGPDESDEFPFISKTKVDASHDAFFRDWRAYNWPDQRFIKLLERAANPTARPDRDQRVLVAHLNSVLTNDSLALVEATRVSGRPTYVVQQIGDDERVLMPDSAPAPSNHRPHAKGPVPSTTVIFISHSSLDGDLAAEFVDYLKVCLRPPHPAPIRCTSAEAHGLAPGSDPRVQLREDIVHCACFIYLASRHSRESKWVMFELGARWALNRPIVPMVHPHDTLDAIVELARGPIATPMSDSVKLFQLVHEVARLTGWPLNQDVGEVERARKRIARFIEGLPRADM